MNRTGRITRPGPAAAGTAEVSGSGSAGPVAVGPSLGGRLAGMDAIWIFLALLVLIAVFTALRPEEFSTVFNVRNVLIDAATLLVLGVGMTYIIISGGIDLSIGSVLVFSGVVSAKVMLALDGSWPLWLAIAAGLLTGLGAGTAWGVLNGVLVAKAHLPPLIVTLATLGGALGAAQLLTGGVDVRGVPVELSKFGLGRVLGVPWLVIVAIVITTLGALVLKTTRFGEHTYAIGSNIVAARRVGIAVDRHIVKLYALQGLLAGFAAFMSLSRFNTTTIAGNSTTNLTVIAAVVLGGTSLFGGYGAILGTIIGVLIPAVLQNGFVILGVQPFWQAIAVSVILILAVWADHLKRRQRERG